MNLTQPPQPQQLKPPRHLQLRHDKHKQRKSFKSCALRLADTKTLTRQAWLEVRKHGIGSSDAAAAVGLNPYQSQLELWMDKTGRSNPWIQINPDDETSPTYWGHILEPIVAAHYSKRTGFKVRRCNAVLQHPHPTLHFMLANIDREVIGSPEAQILECKTAGINGARLWRDGVPEYVELQVLHQLAVTGKQAADVAVLLGGQDLKIYRIERDEQKIKKLIELEAHFWQLVQNDMPPPVDGTESSEMALRALYPEDSGETLDFTQDLILSDLYRQLITLRESIAVDAAQAQLIKQQIQQAMGNASKAQLEGLSGSGFITWKKSADRIQLNQSALLQDHPELLQQYPMLVKGSRRFVVGDK